MAARCKQQECGKVGVKMVEEKKNGDEKIADLGKSEIRRYTMY